MYRSIIISQLLINLADQSKSIKGPGVGWGTLPGLQGAGHGLQCKAEGREIRTGR